MSARALETGIRVTDARSAIFVRLFGLSLVAHVLGNSAQPDIPSPVGLINLVVGLLGLILTVSPSRAILLAASMTTLLSVAAEMPTTGNHWLLAGFMSVAILSSKAKFERYVGTLRWILIVFYGFAAFAKLNEGFFDPDVSCAVFYTNESLTAWGLPPLASGSILRKLVIWATVGAEVSVVPLLLIRKTRFLGVFVASVFHILISFDLGQHFYDFTSVILALLFTFLPEESMNRFRETRALNRFMIDNRRLSVAWLVLGAVGVAVAVTPPMPATLWALRVLPFVLWIPFSFTWIWSLMRARSPSNEKLMTLNIAGVALVAVVSANGIAPYLEVKTAQGFNMYSNLLTAGGETNHLVIPRTISLRAGYEGPVRILETNDAGLEQYALQGYLVAYPELRRYLAIRPKTSISYERFGQQLSFDPAHNNPELVDPGPWWWRFLPLRSIDTHNPPRCQAFFLAAR